MFNRTYIKDMAKARLNGGSGNAILVLFLAGLFGGISGSFLEFRFGSEINMDLGHFELPSRILAIFSTVFVVQFVLILLYGIFVGNVLTVGARGWFLRYGRGEYPNIGDMFAGFRIYLPAVKTMILRELMVFLWGLITCGIMGIVKSYAYSMTEYILCENPNLPPSRAMKMSEILTDGAKVELFVFDLSFIGWELLSSITCGILGILYVNPYIWTAHAGIYDTLKDAAIRSGKLTWEDFGQLPPPPPVSQGPVFPSYGF